MNYAFYAHSIHILFNLAMFFRDKPRIYTDEQMRHINIYLNDYVDVTRTDV